MKYLIALLVLSNVVSLFVCLLPKIKEAIRQYLPKCHNCKTPITTKQKRYIYGKWNGNGFDFDEMVQVCEECFIKSGHKCTEPEVFVYQKLGRTDWESGFLTNMILSANPDDKSWLNLILARKLMPEYFRVKIKKEIEEIENSLREWELSEYQIPPSETRWPTSKEDFDAFKLSKISHLHKERQGLLVELSNLK
jgi:hypothetical protein